MEGKTPSIESERERERERCVQNFISSVMVSLTPLECVFYKGILRHRIRALSAGARSSSPSLTDGTTHKKTKIRFTADRRDDKNTMGHPERTIEEQVMNLLPFWERIWRETKQDIPGRIEGSHDKWGVTSSPGCGEHQGRREAGNSNTATSRRPSLEFRHQLLPLRIQLNSHVFEGKWAREGMGVCMKEVTNTRLIRPMIPSEC